MAVDVDPQGNVRLTETWPSGSPDLTWANLGPASWSTVSGRRRLSTTSGEQDGYQRAQHDLATLHQVVEAPVWLSGTSASETYRHAGVVARYSASANTGYLAVRNFFQGNHIVYLVKMVAGVETVLASETISNPGDGSVIRLEAEPSGSNVILRVSVNDTQVLTHTDTSQVLTGPRCGIVAYRNTGTLAVEVGQWSAYDAAFDDSEPAPATGVFVLGDATSLDADGYRASIGAVEVADTAAVDALGHRASSGGFAGTDHSTVDSAGWRTSTGSTTIADAAAVTTSGHRDSTGATDLADTATVDVAGQRSSTGTADLGDTTGIVGHGHRGSTATVDLADTVHITWAGRAPDPDVHVGRFVIHDTTAAGWAAARPSTGGATLHDRALAHVVAHRPSAATTTLVDTTTVTWHGQDPDTIHTGPGQVAAVDLTTPGVTLDLGYATVTEAT